MLMIEWHLLLIVLTWKLRNVNSIQCCVDRICTEGMVDCPSNVCFKFGFKTSDNQTEERGCLADFLSIMGAKNFGRHNPDNDDDDICQKTTDGTSLCKCPIDFCNSSTRNSHLASWIFISLLTYFL